MGLPLTSEMIDRRTLLKATILPVLDDLYRVALSLTHSSNDAEELVADTVARACQNIASLRDNAKAKQWLLRILTNAFLSSRRSKKRHMEVYYDEQEDEENPFSLFEAVAKHHADDGNPELAVINKLMDEDIRRAIAQLPEEYRTVVVLCDVEGYAYQESAAILDVPIGTIRSRLSRGRGLLQKRLYHYAIEHGWFTPNTATSKEKPNNGPCNCK